MRRRKCRVSHGVLEDARQACERLESVLSIAAVATGTGRAAAAHLRRLEVDRRDRLRFRRAILQLSTAGLLERRDGLSMDREMPVRMLAREPSAAMLDAITILLDTSMTEDARRTAMMARAEVERFLLLVRR